jgi:hypothetical protein
MLWAQFQPRNEAEAAGFFIGIMVAGIVSGGIPFFTGLSMRQLPLGIIGGVISAGAGALAGCCAGIPVALFFTIIIVVVANVSGSTNAHTPPDRFPAPITPEEYDDYVRALQLPGRERERERRREARPEEQRKKAEDDEWRRRSEDEDRYRERGFRPRRRDDA